MDYDGFFAEFVLLKKSYDAFIEDTDSIRMTTGELALLLAQLRVIPELAPVINFHHSHVAMGSAIMTGDRAVHIGAGVSNSIIQTGDGSVAHLTLTQLPDPASVDIHEAMAELRAAFAEMSCPETGKVGRALDDAEEEIARDEPDKAEVAGIITRALNYARKAADFSEHLEKIAPLVTRIAGWVGAGAASAPLLAAVGLAAG